MKCVCSSTTLTHFPFFLPPILSPPTPQLPSRDASKNNFVCAVKLGHILLRCPPLRTKSFKSIVGGFKSYFACDTHSLIAQPRPPTANHASTCVPRLPSLPALGMCPREGVRSAATSGMPKTQRLRARRLKASPSRLPSMQWQNSRARLTPVAL